MSRLLTRKGFFSPSALSSLTVNDTEWVTDNYSMARADICSVTVARGVDHYAQDVDLSIVEMLTADPLMPITNHGTNETPGAETVQRIGAGNMRANHSPSIWAAWMRTDATPHLAIVGGTDAVVVWVLAGETVGFTALRRWSA